VKIFSIFLSLPITNVVRRAYPGCFSSNAPYALAIAWSASERSGNEKSFFSAHAALASGVSNETPTIAASFSWSFAERSRNPQPSFVHPPVSALG
jgi:hypothetical protein